MADIYIINSKNPQDIVSKLEYIDSNNNYEVLNIQTSKLTIKEIQSLCLKFKKRKGFLPNSIGISNDLFFWFRFKPHQYFFWKLKKSNKLPEQICTEPIIINLKKEDYDELFYQEIIDIIAIYYDKNLDFCWVIKKPDEFKIENLNKIYYRYGLQEKFFFGLTEVPKWLYEIPAEKLNPQDYFLLTNADVKTEFIKKIGITKLIELGIEVDSYENYPDNEMWAKSEYKIIDMNKLNFPEITTTRGGGVKFFEYAPFLYMKNQTTGAYHLEGIHPRCKTLYDAIKMRYSGLNIKDYVIKDIK